MSVEELNSLKEEIYLKLREFEQKTTEKLNAQTTEINSNYEQFREKMDNILSNNRQIIESVIAEKINYEKIQFLENFQKKADGMLISHEIRINNINKDIGNMKTKYDRTIVDNLSVPGFIGPSCQYKSIAEYISYNRDEFSRLKYEKENLKQDLKEIRTKVDNQFKQIISLVDNSIERCKEYANDKIVEYKGHFDTKFDEFGERAMEIRLELRDTKTDMKERMNDLKLETEKVLSMNEKFNEFDEKISNTNLKIDKINYDINKLYEKSKNIEKNKDLDKIKKDFEKMKRDFERIKKMISENRSKNKGKEREKDNKNNNSKIYVSTIENDNMNKITNGIKKKEKGRASLFLPDDKRTFSNLPESSTLKAIYDIRNSLEKLNFNSPYKNNPNYEEGIKNKSIMSIKSKKSESTKALLINDSKESPKDEKKIDFEISNNNDFNINKKTIENIQKENNEEKNININNKIQKIQNIIVDKENKVFQIENKNNLNIVIEKSEKLEITDNSISILTNSIKNENKEKEAKTISDFSILQNEKKSKNSTNIKPFVNCLVEENINNITLTNENNFNKENIINKNNIELNKSNNIGEKIFPMINIQTNSLNLKSDNSTLKNNNIMQSELVNKNNLINNNNKIVNNNNILINNNHFQNNNINKLINNINISKVNNNNSDFNNNDIVSNYNDNIDNHNIYNRNNSESKNNSESNTIINNSTSNIFNSNRSSSKRNSFKKNNYYHNNSIFNKDNKKIDKNKNFLLNYNSRNSKKNKHKYEMTQWKNNSNDFFNSQEMVEKAIRPTLSPYLPKLGLNYVGLNVENKEDEDFDDIRISYSGNKLQNLRLEGIGISSPNSQKIERKKIRLQGICNEAPLKISAAFGRTAYTFIDKNNDKNKIYSIKNFKRKKGSDRDNLDLFFAPNNK